MTTTIRMAIRLIGGVLLLWSAQVAAQPKCPGDLNGDARVTVDEVLTSVNHVLTECPARFTDNGDGTISDNWTGLLWEKKSDDGSIHDWQNQYTWSTGAPWDPDGTAFTDFLLTLNGTMFAGHDDWRLPTIEELITLIDFERSAPAIDPLFHDNCERDCTVPTCSCTVSGSYWSVTSWAFNPNFAWLVDFGFGTLTSANKAHLGPVRAVRGGL